MPDLPWSHRTLFQVSVLGTCIGSLIVTVFTYEATQAHEATLTSDALAQSSSGDLADDWLTANKTTWLACHTNDYVLTMVKSQVLERPGNFRHKLVPVERPQTTANVGTQTGQTEQASGSIVVRWRTPQAGKSHRGRTFLGPLSENVKADGIVSAAFRTPYNNWAQAHFDAFAADATPPLKYVHTVYSRPYNMGEYQYATRKTGTLTVVTPPDYAGNSTNITAYNIDWTLRNQRRRNLGVGA